MSLPRLDFAVIGAGKCGTTTLYHALRAHPEVFLPAVKETNFFALRGQDLGGHDPESFRHWPEAVTDDAEWATLFADAQPDQRTGEVCPMYLYSPIALENLARLQPDVRLVVVLRDPVDRLWSRHLHLVRDGRSPAPFEAVRDPGSIWWRRPDLIPEGRYATHLEHVDRWFPRDRVLVLFHEQLRTDPVGTLARLASYLDLTRPLSLPGARHNASGRVRSPALQRLIGPGGPVSKLASALPDAARHGWARDALERVRGRNLERVSCPPALRRELLNSVYDQEIERLQGRLAKDLTDWRAA